MAPLEGEFQSDQPCAVIVFGLAKRFATGLRPEASACRALDVFGPNPVRLLGHLHIVFVQYTCICPHQVADIEQPNARGDASLKSNAIRRSACFLPFSTSVR